jgi:hypothetical protein
MQYAGYKIRNAVMLEREMIDSVPSRHGHRQEFLHWGRDGGHPIFSEGAARNFVSI